MDPRAPTSRIAPELSEQIGIRAIVDETDDTIVLTGTVDSPEARDAAEHFVATLPGVTLGERGDVEVLGWFSATSLDAVEGDLSAEEETGDEAIAEAVQRELREDAATTDLTVHVQVRRGVVRLRGTVPTIEDALSAEEVAARVPGVREVREELEVEVS